MCYRTSQIAKPYEFAAYYKGILKTEDDAEPYFHANGFSHPNLVILLNNKEGYRIVDRMQWGLMPPWKKPLADMLKLSNNTLNAKSETVFELPSFKSSIISKRCILPVEGFFEYKEVDKNKQPYFIHPKNHPYFNIACIYSYYENPENKHWIKSFSILTGPANNLMTDIHNTKFRQPIIISNDQITSWLDSNISKEEIIHLLNPCDDSNMAAYRVDRELIKIGNVPDALKQVPEEIKTTLF